MSDVGLTLEQQAVLVDELTRLARDSILDQRVSLVPDWVWDLPDGHARQLLQSVAFLAAVSQLGLEHAQELLRGWQG